MITELLLMSSILSKTDKSLKPVFRENTEIQAFFLLRKNSFNCNFAVVCEEITVVFHTFSHEIHTKKGGITLQQASSLTGAEFLYAII